MQENCTCVQTQHMVMIILPAFDWLCYLSLEPLRSDKQVLHISSNNI